MSIVGAAALAGLRPGPAEAEPPLETTTLRLLRTPSICWAAQYVAEDLLHDEGFTHVMYPYYPGGPVSPLLAAGEGDISMNFIAPNLIRLEFGGPSGLPRGGTCRLLRAGGDGSSPPDPRPPRENRSRGVA